MRLSLPRPHIPVQQTTSGIGHTQCKVLVVFFGLATKTLDVRNNKQQRPVDSQSHTTPE